MKQFSILRYVRQFSLLILLLSLAGSVVIYRYGKSQQRFVASAVIRYTNTGAKNGYTPDGSPLNVEEIYSSTVIDAALRDLGYSCSLINARFVKPLDEQCLMRAAASHRLIVTLEENVRTGGFGDHVLEFLNDIGSEVRVINIALPDEYIEHGSVDVLRAETGLDRDSILKRIIAEYAGMPQE